MSQTLCKNTKGKRSLAYELMVNTPAIGNLIREKKLVKFILNYNQVVNMV